MDIEPQNFFQILKEHSQNNFRGPSECLRLLSILNYNLTEEQLNASLIDLYMTNMFDRSNGLFKFILAVAPNTKFDNATSKALEIIYTLINNFSNKIEDHILDINDNSLKILQSKASAKVRAKAVDILLISFEKVDKCLENQEKYSVIFNGIQTSLIQAIHSDSVRQKEFIAVGLFAKRFSYLITDPRKIKNYFVTQLDNQMTKGPSQGIINGIFTGLTYFCDSFPLSLDSAEDELIVQRLYKYIKDLSNVEEKVRFGNRAAILYFATNQNLFIKMVVKEYKQWHKRLLTNWLKKGPEEMKVGEQALKALLRNIADSLIEMEKNECMPLLNHFIGWFKFIFRNPNALHIERKLCIQGLKYFSLPLYKYYAKEDAREVFLLVMQNFEKIYILNGSTENEEWEFLPDYIQCLASFMRYQSFTNSEIYCLQKSVISMIKAFHILKPLHHSIVIDALVTTLFYLKETQHFDAFLENIIYQGVLWSCSHQHVTDSDLISEHAKIVTVNNYFPLWRGLLKLVSNHSYDKVSIYLEDRQFISTKILNELVKTLMILINKLNVNVKLKEDVIQTDIEAAYQVEQSNDFAIFLNVIDFYQELFVVIEPEMFKYCICRIINHLVAKCLKCPLISGFYKLLSFALKTSNNLKLFDKGNITLNQDIVNCKETLAKFLTSLLHKMKQFKDELLISCLHVLLESPLVVVEPLLPECAGIFKSVFEIGRSYLALANMGLTTLERWQQFFDKDQFEAFLLQVIPYLDSYLRSRSLGEFSQANVIERKRKTAQGLKKRTILVELEPELVKFQKRVLHFIGTQNSKVCQAFVSSDHSFERIVTNENVHLKVTIPYADLSLEMHLEPFIMRVVELSLYSSDRKTRVMACELLQAFIMVFLGRTKQMSLSSLSDLDDLLKNIAMPLLQLACDIDQVVRQIFEPLFMQLIHWFTSKTQRENPHLAMIIEVLMDGVTHPTNSSLRDFSGKCIHEFVKWTIKQSSTTELQNNPINIKVLVKRIRFFGGHPDLMKKLGAALIFNNIYKEIREERALISMFCMELLHIFICSLSLLDDSSEEVDSTVLQIVNAINHLKRIFIEKHQLFCDCDQLRRVPSDIPEGNMKGLSTWLLSMTSSRSKYCRDISIDLLIHLQPLSDTKESLPEFVEKYSANIISLYVKYLIKYPTLEGITSTEDYTILQKWLQGLLCLIDGYIFVIKNSLCAVRLENKNDFLSISYFLKNMQTATLEQGLKLIYKNSTIPYYTSINKEQFSNMKSSCSLGILKLANVILNDELLCNRSSAFWNKQFWNLIVNYVFSPSSLGFDERVTLPEYLDILTLVLNIMPAKLNENSVKELVSILGKYVIDHFDADIDLRRNINLKQRNTVKGLLLIQSTQLNKLFVAEQYSKGLVDKLINSFLNNLDGNTIYIGSLSEITVEHCCLILKFALKNPEEFAALLPYIYTNTYISCQEMTQIDKQMTLGMYFLTKFADPVAKVVVNDFDKFLERCDNMDVIVKLTSHLLKYLEEHKSEFKSNFGKVLDCILSKWLLFQKYFEENNVDLGLDFIRQVSKTFRQSLPYSGDIQKWILTLIVRDEILMSEQEGLNLYLNIFSVFAEVVEDDVDDLSSSLEIFKSKLQSFITTDQEKTILAEQLLTFLPTAKNQAIIKFIIEFYISNKPVASDHTDLTEVLKTFILKSTEENQRKMLLTMYHLAIYENNSFEQKNYFVTNVLPYVFKYSKYNLFELFFEENIKEIMERLKNATDFGNGLVDFLLVELLFLRVPIGSEQRTRCDITEASGNPKLRAQLLKSALDAFKDNSIEGTKEQSRLYKCGAYKCLASIISNSIKSENFYEKLFIREENSEDILWSVLIDTNVVYNFPVDFDSYPKKRKILVNIRDELRQQSDFNSSKSLRYIESQRLFNSSLSEDVTKFDYSTSVLQMHRSTNQPNVEDKFDEEDLNVETKFVQGEIYLEATEINNHELMGTVCGVIEHIFASGVCQLPENDDEMAFFPVWMDGIRNLLLNPKTYKNIKIFWVKVIDNMVNIFRFFAKYFVEPLLQFLREEIAGNTINYFVSDVVVVLASWTCLIQPNEKEAKLASNLLGRLIQGLKNERKDAFKYNLDLIKLIVENWKGFIEVPYDNLYAKLNFAITDRAIEVGIHLASIFLVNNMLPCEEKDINTFRKKLKEILASSVNTIYKPCAETVGLLLKYFKLQQMEDSAFGSTVSKIILNFGNVNQYAGSLEGVAIHYPEVVDSYHIVKMLNRLSQSDLNVQITFLKIILKRVDILSDIDPFKKEDWCKYLESQNAEIQLITLEIILKTFSILKEEKSFKEIAKSIGKNLQNPNTFCRGRMYDIFMAIIENGEVIDQDVIELSKEVLIQGLVDTDIEIRKKVRMFWSDIPSIPLGIADRFPYLMSNFYLAKTEEHFLGYVSYFLLNSIDSDEYEKELFDHPLEDCDFEEYKLQTNWRMQHPSVVPMFAETLRTYSEGLDETASVNFGFLRATQDNYTFAPTQQTIRERYISQISSLESSLIGVSVGNSISNEKFVNPNQVRLSEDYKLPKRRFLKDKAKVSAHFAHIAVAHKIKKAVQRYDAVKESEKKVTIYRSYRKGDFPDIQITLGSLIKPLQMLVLHDSELSNTFFSMIFKTLKEKLKSVSNDFTNTVSASIKRIFNDSVQYNAYVFSTLLDILLNSKREIRMDPDLISNVCQQSGLISVGTLVIEEYLMSIEDTASSSKRGVGSENVEIRHWLKLAELYKELREWNLVRTIFLEKSNCKEEVHKALELESEKRWREAQEKYEQLVTIDLSPERQDFYYESYFKCLAHLGEWEKLPKAVEALVPRGGENTWNSLWDNDWFQRKILPWYVSSQIKNTLFSGKDSGQFLLDINKSLSNPEQAEYLRNKFSEEICVLWLTQQDTAQARQYLKSSLENFLGEWQLLNPLFGNLRYNKVLNLRTLIEIDRFLYAERNLVEDSEDRLKCLQGYWKSTQKEFLPSIILSEARLLYRKLFIKLLVDKLMNLNHLDLAKELKKTTILLDISFMNSAVEEENYYMTRKYFREYVSMKHPSLSMIYGNLAYLYSNLVKKDPGLKLEKLLEALKKFREVVESTQNEQVMPSLLKIFDISRKTVEVLSNNPELYAKYENQLANIFGSESSSFMDVACHSLRTEALKDTSDKEIGHAIIVDEKTKALVKLAYYVQDQQDRQQDFILYVLRAMRLGSKEARQLFPCILLMESLDKELKDIFVNESENIPTWMFLGWIPQLLANADSCKVTAISEIILRIARTYPQAIMYSYRLSKGNYSNTDHSFSEETKRLTEQLDRLLLNNPVVDTFLMALSKVNVPLATLDYYIKKMTFSSDINEIVEIRDALSDFFFKDSSDSRNSNSMQGNMYKSTADFKKEFHKITSRLTISEVKNVMKAVRAKYDTMLKSRDINRKSSFSKMLKDYCPWLENFSAGKLNLELEIPGQYTGDKLPLVQHHVKISGFGDTVSVMSSLRQPIKVTMIGMDSKEYPFLVKFGEDIRQDQRIQQLFMLMNNIFANDNKNHHILTYQVIPLTSSLGIIQWVEHTVSLEDLIKKSIPNKDRNRILLTIQDKYQKFLERGLQNIDIYGLTAIKKDKDKVIPFYLGLVNEVPLDVLSKSIWSMSLTTEHFIAFRNNFIKSYATVCACQWILGIGDRHLQNSKVCLKNGKVLGIDFGHAFGTATQILPVPELVPIRLTPHIVDLMKPLKEKGPFRDIMIDCLRSLRENSNSLLATMNVFIQEPSVDWLENVKKFEMAGPSDTHQWYPLQKVEQAKRKLQGAASSTILIEDLKSSSYNALKPQYFKAYIAFVKGDQLYNLRTKLDINETLSVEQQVESLIDHATDPNLLGRMYSGWHANV